jgi:integrase
MNRRVGQNGNVFVKAACKAGNCGHSVCLKYGRAWIDVPGQAERKRVCFSLGPVTQTVAERELRKKIIALGIDSAETFQKVTSDVITFKAASKRWLAGIADGSIVSKKSREVMKPATISAYQSCVAFLNDKDKGCLADVVLADLNNGEAKKLIARMKALTPKLTNKTIVTYFQTVQNVVASVEKDNGDKMYPRDWNLVFIGLPKIDTRKQNKPAFDASEIETILSKAKAPYRTLYALLAGSGLRVGEAVGLRVEHVLDNCTRLVVEQSVWGGKEQDPKTASAFREVDLCDELAYVLDKHIVDRKDGFVFRTKSGRPISPRNIARDSLDPILEEMEAKKDGKLFHSFRRFRSEVLRKNRVPWQLEKQWLGHAGRDISDRYAEGLSDDLQWRKQVAQQTGLGFSIPLGQPGQLSVEENLLANVA